MFPKTSWEVDDVVVVNGKHGKIKEFNSSNTKVYVEHRDNENQPYVRWYEMSELPPFGEPTVPLPEVETEAAPKAEFKAGQLVRLTRDLVDDTTYPRPTRLYKGDVGEVSNYMGSIPGFRMNGQTSFTRVIDGVKVNVLDFCELIADEVESIPTPSPSPASQGGEQATVTQAPENLKPGMVLWHKTQNFNRVIQSVDGLTITLARGLGKVQWDSSLYEIREPSAEVMMALLTGFASQNGRIEELEQKLRDKEKQIANQSASLEQMMKVEDSQLQDKYEQLHDDYEALEREHRDVKAERTRLAELNQKQSEMLKEMNKYLDAFRVVGEFLSLDKTVAPKMEAI